MYKEEIVHLANNWTLEALTKYIEELETRMADTHSLLLELKRIRKRKSRLKVYDNGPRDNR